MHGGKLPLDIEGRRLRVGFESLEHYRQVRAFHTFEPGFLDEFRARARDAGVVYDVGANLGLYSLTAGACNGEAEVHSFEPEPGLCRLIEESALANGLSGIHVLPMCLGEADSTLQLTLKGNSGHFVSRDGAAEGTVEVPVRRVDSLVREGALPPPDLVKIDVEGYEASVLRGMAGVLEQHHPTVLVEVHPRELEAYGESADGVDAFMAALNYERTLLRAPGVGGRTTHRQTHVRYLHKE
jgi:FkbM family methyltransferase